MNVKLKSSLEAEISVSWEKMIINATNQRSKNESAKVIVLAYMY